MSLQSPDESLRCSSHAAELTSPDSSVNDIVSRDGFHRLDLGVGLWRKAFQPRGVAWLFKAALACLGCGGFLVGRFAQTYSTFCTYPKSQVSIPWLFTLGVV